jgi:hypothetical protein
METFMPIPETLTPLEHAAQLRAAIARAVDQAIASEIVRYRAAHEDCPWDRGQHPDTLAVAREHLEELLDQVLPYVLHRPLGTGLFGRFPTAAELAAVDE